MIYCASHKFKSVHTVGLYALLCEDGFSALSNKNVLKLSQKQEKGVTYQNIRGTEDILKALPPVSYPTTYFVDSEGKVLTTPIQGARVDKYPSVIEEQLEAIK